MTQLQLIKSKEFPLGYPLPTRRDYFERHKAAATHKERVELMGTTHYLPVIKIPIGLPKYRLLNGRTVSMQQEYIAQHPKLDKDFFSRDFESEEAHLVQHELLKQLIKRKDLYELFKNKKNKQDQPLYLDENGFVINGNRRLCAWRELYKADKDAYSHFEYIDVIVLPPCDDKSIDELEARLQVVPDIRDDYVWHSLANMMKQRMELHGFDIDSIAKIYRKSKKEVEQLIQALEYADEYLTKRGKQLMWSVVSDDEHSFRRMVENRNGFTTPGAKKLFEESCFVLIDYPEGGRVYEAIPKMKKHFDAIMEELQNEFNVEPAQDGDGLGLLGGPGAPTICMPLAVEIEKEDNRAKACEIIREVINSLEQLEKDKESATFLLKRLQKANTFVTEAFTIGLRPESKRSGVKEQIDSIEDGLARIKTWLDSNA